MNYESFYVELTDRFPSNPFILFIFGMVDEIVVRHDCCNSAEWSASENAPPIVSIWCQLDNCAIRLHVKHIGKSCSVDANEHICFSKGLNLTRVTAHERSVSVAEEHNAVVGKRFLQARYYSFRKGVAPLSHRVMTISRVLGVRRSLHKHHDWLFTWSFH